MNERFIIDKYHFVIKNSNGTGKTSFACNKSRSFIYCEQSLNFCPKCGDSLGGTGT